MTRFSRCFRASPLLLISLTACARAEPPKPDAAGFIVKPYVQLGNVPKMGETESLTILWQTQDTEGDWTVEANGKRFTAKPQRVALVDVTPFRVYRANLTGLSAGKPVPYRVLKAGKSVFSATAMTRKPASAPYKFVVFGDCADNTPGQKAIAYYTYLLKPDFVFITGDIVYSRGLMSEYYTKYFPIYNAETASKTEGAPLIRSTVFLASPGNHDILDRNLDKRPDSLAYYFNWAQPLNGPLTVSGSPNTSTLQGDAAHNAAFVKAAGSTYPVMANFSYDYGNSHWTVLDANPYMNWSDPKLVAWLEHDLASAQGATWRFVGYHHPPFNSSDKHKDDQWMRVIEPILEKYHVDIVFNGHVHNYQRTYPLKFKPTGKRTEDGHVEGDFSLDKKFNGTTITKPNGTLYLITGGGGAHLYDPAQMHQPETWKPFTVKFVSDIHSLTCVDVTGKTLKVKQIDENGKEIDRFTVTK